jgi:exopolyphosphatase / guanosine-5'-triphosphate,3'-diphosphate pyrophosphatase
LTRVAALDCGTNTLRLLIADLDVEAGRAVDVHRCTTIVRLGQGVDSTRTFAEEALSRTFAALEHYAELIRAAGPEKVRFVATSAVRDVSNRDAFVAGVDARIGVRPDVISGEEEARLSYEGATRGLAEPAGGGSVGPLLVVDVGGGSTELVSKSGQSGPLHGESLDIGSVRLTERHLHDDPPARGQVAAAVADIESALDGASQRLYQAGTLIGVSGTVTTMIAMALGLERYDSDRIHRASVPTGDLLTACDEIVAMPVAERRRLGFMEAGRADVIGGGALVLAAVVRRTGLETVMASEHDILDAVAWSLV